MANDDEDVCPTCGGDGVVSGDTTDSSHEHTTVESPCPDCGDNDCGEPDYDYREDDY